MQQGRAGNTISSRWVVVWTRWTQFLYFLGRPNKRRGSSDVCVKMIPFFFVSSAAFFFFRNSLRDNLPVTFILLYSVHSIFLSSKCVAYETTSSFSFHPWLLLLRFSLPTKCCRNEAIGYPLVTRLANNFYFSRCFRFRTFFWCFSSFYSTSSIFFSCVPFQRGLI